MYACLAVTCHLHFWQNDRDFLRATVVTRGWNGYRNKSQHRKSTLEKKILPPFQQGFEPATFQSRVRCSNHWAIPPPPPPPRTYSCLPSPYLPPRLHNVQVAASPRPHAGPYTHLRKKNSTYRKVPGDRQPEPRSFERAKWKPRSMRNTVWRTNSKHWFTTSFLGGRCGKAMLGVCVEKRPSFSSSSYLQRW